MEASLPVNGAAEEMTSYRAELFGILALLLITATLMRSNRDAVIRGTIFCDNEQAVKRVNEIRHKIYPHSIKKVVDEEHDVLHEIRTVIETVHETVKVD